MLKVLGVCLVVLSCTALGFERSLKLTRRLSGLRELQRMVLLIKERSATARRRFRRLLSGQQAD